MTSMRRNDVASTSFRRHVPNRFLINQCQIITFLILKYDIIENSRIELRGIVLPVQVGGLLGGPKGMLAPPLKLLGGPGPPWPPLFLRLCCYWFQSTQPVDVNVFMSKTAWKVDQGQQAMLLCRWCHDANLQTLSSQTVLRSPEKWSPTQREDALGMFRGWRSANETSIMPDISLCEGPHRVK